jgi:hypothetical protein
MTVSVPDFVQSMRGMFALKDYHFPIVAAQFQYRERYYGLSSAAMLEDLFFDALSNFVHTYQPTCSLTRPSRGEKGYDYEFNGEKISHKVSASGPDVIAALWDATRTDLTEWTFETPISFTTGSYSRRVISCEIDGKKLQLRPLSVVEDVEPTDLISLVHWPDNSRLTILKLWRPVAAGAAHVVVPFDDVWQEVARHSEVPVNELEVLVVQTKKSTLVEGSSVEVRSDNLFRPGAYFFRKDHLVQVPVRTNNRGVLVSKELVRSFMRKSEVENNFVPTSTWFAKYAGSDPPDLYLAQKSEFDLMFAAHRRAWRYAAK